MKIDNYVIVGALFLILLACYVDGAVYVGTVNETVNLVWEQDYNYTITCLSGTTTDTLVRMYAGDQYYEDSSIQVGGNISTSYTFVYKPEEIGPDNLKVCDNITQNISVICEYDVAGTYTNYTNYTYINMSHTSVACIVNSTVDLNNYTVTDINNTYIAMDVPADASYGSMFVRWDTSVHNATHDFANLRCTNATVSNNPLYPLGPSLNVSKITINGSGSALHVECEPDPQYDPTGPSSIPIAVGAGALVIVGTGAYLLRRRFF